jgi:cation diffusion facilitator family transporter
MDMIEERTRAGKRAAEYGIVGNFFLTIFKFVIGVISNSTAIIADAVDSFSDFVMSLVVWVGLKKAVKYPDEEHPYGHGDLEPLAGLIASIILCVLGFEIARHSVLKAMKVTGPPEVLAVLAIIPTVLLKEWMARYTLKVSEKIKSPALKAGAMNYRGDIYSSFIVIAGLIGAGLGFPILDPIAGFIIALLILKMGVSVGKENVEQLIGTVPSPGLIEEVKNAAEKVPGARCIHNIRIHAVGAFATVDLHVCVDESLSIEKAHEIATIIQDRIVEKFPEINYALVHVEPYDKHHKVKYGRK